MFDAIKKLFSDLGNSEAESTGLAQDDVRLAEAALLFHVIAVDGIVESEEQARLTSLLAERFELEKDQATQLMEDARQADQQAVDLYRFTSVLMRSLEHEERVAIIENMWEMVYADGVVHEMEDNIVWRVAELLAVDSRERVLLKQRVRDRTGNS